MRLSLDYVLPHCALSTHWTLCQKQYSQILCACVGGGEIYSIVGYTAPLRGPDSTRHMCCRRNGSSRGRRGGTFLFRKKIKARFQIRSYADELSLPAPRLGCGFKCAWGFQSTPKSCGNLYPLCDGIDTMCCISYLCNVA